MALPDINDLALMNEVIEADGSVSADEFFAPPLPDDGDHQAVLYLGERGVSVSRQKDPKTKQKTGPAFLNVHLMAKILDPQTGQEGLTVFDNPTSIIMNNGSSKLHAILGLIGESVPGRMTIQDLKELAERALAQTPRIGLTTQWEAQANHGTKDAPDYETLIKGQKRFPPIYDEQGNPSGRFEAEVTDPKTGEKVRAQARVIRYSRAK
jgi:hypothetical protein